MPIYSKKGDRRRERRVRKMHHRAKWVAVLLSAVLLVATMMLVRAYRPPAPGGILPDSVDPKSAYRAH